MAVVCPAEVLLLCPPVRPFGSLTALSRSYGASRHVLVAPAHSPHMFPSQRAGRADNLKDRCAW